MLSSINRVVLVLLFDSLSRMLRSLLPREDSSLRTWLALLIVPHVLLIIWRSSNYKWTLLLAFFFHKQLIRVTRVSTAIVLPTNFVSLSTSKQACTFQVEITVFENHPKCRIQQCERSELHLHFEWTKVHKNAKNLRGFLKLKLVVKQCYQTWEQKLAKNTKNYILPNFCPLKK